jgi:hypothetical protein
MAAAMVSDDGIDEGAAAAKGQFPIRHIRRKRRDGGLERPLRNIYTAIQEWRQQRKSAEEAEKG